MLILTPLATPAAADDLRPPVHVGGAPALAPATEFQLDAAVASCGASHLVVWSDARSAVGNDIYGLRVGLDGTLLDRDGLAISVAAGSQDKPAAAYGAETYLVVWSDNRSATTDIYGSLLAPDGEVVNPAGLAISTAAGAQGYPAVARSESLYLVVWADTRNAEYDIFGARVEFDGTVLDTGGVAICSVSGDQSYPAVASDGTGFLVVWQDSRGSDDDIYGARVSADGTVLDAGGFAVCSGAAVQALPCAAFQQSYYLVAWEDDRSGTSTDVYAARVDAAGTVADPAGIAVCSQAADQVNTTVDCDGANWLVVWNDQRGGSVWNVYAARVDSGGAVLDSGGFAVCTDFSHQYAPSVALADSVYLIAWHDSRNGPKDIYGARVSTSAAVLDSSALLSAASTVQGNADLAFGGANYLAVWQDLRVGTSEDIYGVRLGRDETVLDEEAIAISAAGADQAYPAAGYGAGSYLVAWQDYRNGAWDIYAARIAADGSLGDPDGIAISLAAAEQERPAVASDGSGYLVAWQDKRGGTYDIYAARVTAAGAVLDPGGLVISAAAGDQARPAAAFDGVNYLVVWQDYRAGAYDIYGARVSPAGVVLDPAGVAVSTAANAQESPAVAFDGTRSLVTWQDKRGGPYADIYAARVATDGAVLDPAGLAISTATYDQLSPSVAFEGSYYLVAWQDLKRTATRPDIFAVRVDTAGVKLDAAAFAVSQADYGQTAPATASGLSGQVVIAYTSFTHAPLYGAPRTWANFYGAASASPGIGDRPRLPGLHPNAPNPFTCSTVLSFSLPERAQASLAVYDVRGRLVASVWAGTLGPGLHRFSWTGRASDGARVAPGVYWCRLEAAGTSVSRTLVLVD